MRRWLPQLGTLARRRPVAPARPWRRAPRASARHAEPIHWSDALATFVVCHAIGDYLLQTDWQALHKRGGLSGDPVARRALVTHVGTYTAAYLPALAWIGDRRTLAVALRTGALVALPHLVQDDGRLLSRYAKRVKGLDVREHPNVGMWVDQSFHLVALFATAHAVARDRAK